MEIHFIASEIWCVREQENRKKKFLFKILKKENTKKEISVGREKKQGDRKIKFLFKIPKKEDTKEEISVGRGEKTEENLGKIKVWRYKMIGDFYKIADDLKESQSQVEEAVVFNKQMFWSFHKYYSFLVSPLLFFLFSVTDI